MIQTKRAKNYEDLRQKIYYKIMYKDIIFFYII
jgi:hypothetical protein